MNRMLLDKVRSMLTNANLPNSYWYDTLEYAALLHNVSHTCVLNNLTPEEVWSGNKPDISMYQVFGSRAFMHVPKKKRAKLAAWLLICTFIGLAKNRKAYCLVHRKSGRFFESRDIVFDEGGPAQNFERIILKPDDTLSDSSTETLSATPHAPKQSPSPSDSDSSSETESVSESEIEGLLNEAPTTPYPPPNLPIMLSRPKCTIHVPVCDDDPCYSTFSYGACRRPTKCAAVAHDTNSNPRTYAKAMACPDAAKWELACNEEKHMFEHMGVYKMVPCLTDCKVVGSKWVFKIKCGPNGSIQKHKACLIVQGFTQIKGIDFNKTFVPVMKFASLCTILMLAAKLDLEVHQLDVKSAYLNGDLKEEIFMAPLPGFDTPDGMVLRLKKAVYGMKQGGHTWYEHIRSTLNSMGYAHTHSDHTIFTCLHDGNLSIIALYVDDITMACKSLKVINEDKEILKKTYQMTDLGEITWILGMHITCDCNAGWIALSQERYVNDVLEHFGKANIRLISTPTVPNEHLLKLNSPETDVKSYQSAIGTLMYPMLGTHPNLTYTVAALGCYTANPGEEHLRALDHAFCYL